MQIMSAVKIAYIFESEDYFGLIWSNCAFSFSRNYLMEFLIQV